MTHLWCANRLARQFRTRVQSFMHVSDTRAVNLVYPWGRCLTRLGGIVDPTFATDIHHWYETSTQVPVCVVEVGSVEDTATVVCLPVPVADNTTSHSRA